MVKIKVGDEVVVKKPNYTDKEEQVEWVLSMDDYENSVLTVNDIDLSCSDIFQVEGTHWWFHPNWVTHVNGVPVGKGQPSKGKPSKKERPYENWKMSISRGKYLRCICLGNIVINIEGIVGHLNKNEAIFYYKPDSNKYIAAKVYPFKYPDGSEGWEFVKENCDSLQKSVVPEVNEILTKCDDEKSDILEAVESTKDGILASFGVPITFVGNNYISNNTTVKEDVVNTIGWNWQEESEEYWEKVKSSEGINASLGEENIPVTEWTDKHYDFNYTLTEDDIEKGVIKIDPYFVNEVWRLNSKDSTGIVFHCLKTLARWCDKHEEEREIRAVLGQMKRLAQMRRIDVK